MKFQRHYCKHWHFIPSPNPNTNFKPSLTRSLTLTPNTNPKGKGLDIYMSQTRDQQRFTISEVAADWHEPMVPHRIMWPSIARDNT